VAGAFLVSIPLASVIGRWAFACWAAIPLLWQSLSLIIGHRRRYQIDRD
jgi:hypothetical protein